MTQFRLNVMDGVRGKSRNDGTKGEFSLKNKLSGTSVTQNGIVGKNQEIKWLNFSASSEKI